MKTIVLVILTALAFLAACLPADAQNVNNNCYSSTGWAPCNGWAAGATFITGNATGTTGAVVGTLTAVANKTTYICGFDVSAIGGTATVGPITIAGTITGSMTYELASSVSGNTLGRTFTPCIPASAPNTNITITSTADGSATAVAVNSFGYNQ